MRDIDLLLDLFKSQIKAINKVMTDIPDDCLHWQADDEANSIGLTVWHLARIADVTVTIILNGKNPMEQTWFTSGWAETTSYNPMGKGWMGSGMLTGFTQEDVAEIPQMTAANYRAYFNETYTALTQHLQALPEDGLAQNLEGMGSGKPVYFWYRLTIIDAMRHTGEIFALKAMWERIQKQAEETT